MVEPNLRFCTWEDLRKLRNFGTNERRNGNMQKRVHAGHGEIVGVGVHKSRHTRLAQVKNPPLGSPM